MAVLLAALMVVPLAAKWDLQTAEPWAAQSATYWAALWVALSGAKKAAPMVAKLGRMWAGN